MINKILVIGSGPIVIGQAAEFDYSGTQACRILKKEGKQVVLVNNNPATIMTDKAVADAVYSEPLTLKYLEAIIEKERPDALIAGMGGQTALNLSMQLHEKGILEKYQVQVIGTNIESIEKSEDRELFKATMESIHEPCLQSHIANSLEEAKGHIQSIGYPVVIRPAFTLGGTGGGFCYNDQDLKQYVASGIAASRTSQVLIEKSIKGWKEIEYEMMRDYKGNTIVVCNMENLDPVGVHTGDSIVVAPSQSLPDTIYQQLRTASIRIVNALEIIGGCNVQLALSPDMKSYYVIEVNPRVSRSSALASKATGYPIAKVATQIALGYHLDEIDNDVTKKTKACFEPSLDYCALKIPKWPFYKFEGANKDLSTQMKATGEIMSLAGNFEMALLKGLRSLDNNLDGFVHPEISKYVLSELFEKVTKADDLRLFYVAELLRRQVSIEKLYALTGIERFFLQKIHRIVKLEETLKTYKVEFIERDFFKQLKQLGFSDYLIGKLTLDGSEELVAKRRKALNIHPVFKMVDTCAGEFEAVSPYYYTTYDEYCENTISDQKKIIVIGSGPITIGQGVEFDYCSVHSVLTLQEMGYETILINNNPETVSTDFDIADKLYFEPLTVEDVMHVIEIEKPEGVMLQFGGQTAIKLAKGLTERGIKILGTDFDAIDLAEDRDRFNLAIDRIQLNRPKGFMINQLSEIDQVLSLVQYPVLVRPSYVIGGEGMRIIHDADTLKNHLIQLPVLEGTLIDEFIDGLEIEVDCISDGNDILIPGIMEHLEQAGVHSGDSVSIYPPQNLTDEMIHEIVDATNKISKAFKTVGMMNIQYIYKEKLYVIEVNPRASRTVPFLSKVTNTPMIKSAVKCIMGESLKDLGYGLNLKANQDFVAIKYPVFSLEKMENVDTALSPQMKSTGEMLSIDNTFERAYKKCIEALGYEVNKKAILMTVADVKKKQILPFADHFKAMGYKIYATEGTKTFLEQEGYEVILTGKIGEEDSLLHLIEEDQLDMIINIPTKGANAYTDGFKMRRKAVEQGIPCYTDLKSVEAKIKALMETNTEMKLFDLCQIN
ncbi:MAG: carbamoyl-phosphate synthase (glutamine-hydrolyzing) large subunit [Clostridia bacterium]|nr:carbamoyl-phosphate synthase (glutamine-hydrolyzing) large subunit [Clostridia bacterium]